MFCSACGVEGVRNTNYCHLCRTNTNTFAHMSCVGCGVQTLVEGTNTCVSCKKIQEDLYLGYPYLTIVDLLKKDGMSISLHTLKRKLSKLGLSRRGQNIDEDATTALIQQEIGAAGRLAGYPSIWHALRLRHVVHIPRNLVTRIVKEIDHEGVEFRKSLRLTRRRYMSLGPNFCWHIDSKLQMQHHTTQLTQLLSLSLYLSIYLSIYLFIYLFIYLPIYLSITRVGNLPD